MPNLLPSAGAFLTCMAVAVPFENPPKISKTNKELDVLSFGAFCPLTSLRGKQKGPPCGAQNTHKEAMGHKSSTVPTQLSLSHSPPLLKRCPGGPDPSHWPFSCEANFFHVWGRLPLDREEGWQRLWLVEDTELVEAL